MKRIISLIMAVLMLCALCVTASAAEQAIPNSSLTWELTDNNTRLIIAGEGAMPDFMPNGSDDRPWAAAVNTITVVEIESGVTSIGSYAFFMTNLTEVTIPGSVESIGESAFAMSALEKVTIPDGVKRIGDMAFSSCDKLKELTIPGSIESIGKFAFQDCIALERLTIPDGVKRIGDEAFRYCISLKEVTIPKTPVFFGNNVFTGCASDLRIINPDGADASKYVCQHEKFATGKCEDCGIECPNDFHNGKCPDCGMSAAATASTLSEGNMTVVLCIACAVVFGFGGFILGKKKPALANNNDEE